MNKLSFQVHPTKRHRARLQYRTSNPNSLGGSHSPTLSVHRLYLRSLSRQSDRRINNFVSVLNLRDLDVLVHLVDLLDDFG